MELAITMAEKAKLKGEVPIGAVLVYKNKVIAKSYNKRERKQNALAHAEINVIQKGCKCLKSWRLEDCELYVTLEPCPMCAGAISNARIRKVYIGAKEKTSNDDLCEKIFASTRLNHKVDFEYLQDYQESCSKLLTIFFKEKRLPSTTKIENNRHYKTK